MICKDEVVKWWVVISPLYHKLLQESDCIESREGLYAEYSDGRQEAIDTNLLPHSQWNWENLPIEEIDNVKELIELKAAKELSLLVNKYRIAGYLICCDTDHVLEQFKGAFQNGTIGG